MKVYCKDCKYLIGEGETSHLFKWRCINKDNMQKYDVSNWYEESEEKRYNEKPEEINKHNICQWYAEKK